MQIICKTNRKKLKALIFEIQETRPSFLQPIFAIEREKTFRKRVRVGNSKKNHSNLDSNRAAAEATRPATNVRSIIPNSKLSFPSIEMSICVFKRRMEKRKKKYLSFASRSLIIHGSLSHSFPIQINTIKKKPPLRCCICKTMVSRRSVIGKKHFSASFKLWPNEKIERTPNIS